MLILAAPAFSFEVNDADLPSLVVSDCHLAFLLIIKLSEEQVLHFGNRSIDNEVLPGMVQTNML